jgi:uncharacterized protein with von Willebrand factor type A (vWA) domain
MGMDFRTAGDRVRSMIAAKKPHQLSESALAPDHLRDTVIEYEVTDADGNKSIDKFTWETFPEAVRDVARGAFGYDEPELRPREDIKPSHQFNREVEAAILNHDKFQESRPYTRNNELESLFGAMALAEDMRQNAAQLAAEHIARSEQMREQEGEVEDAEQLLDNLRQQAQQQKADTGQIDPNLVQQAKNAVKQRQQALGNLGQLQQQHAQSNSVQAASQLAASAVQAQVNAVDAAQMLGSLPGTGPGSPHNLKPDQMLSLAEKWARNPSLRKILKEAGRMIRDMRFKRNARTKNVPIEPVDVTTGRDLARLMPHELAQAYRDDTRAAFIDRYSKRSLLEYEYAGKSPAGHGPLIWVMDCSGSMDANLGGASRREWAGSLSLAAFTVASREKRTFAGVHFGSHGELRTWVWPAKQPVDPNDVMEYVTHTFGGGTSTLIGMTEALRLMQDQPEFKTADVVLVGDGQDYFQEGDRQVRDALHKLGVRIHAISIACPNNAYMQQMADHVIDVTDIANDAVSILAEQIT